jgi:hypothetical protein
MGHPNQVRLAGSVLGRKRHAFRLGNEIVKYKLEPETAPRNVPNDARDYLAVDMANRLAQREYRFRFMIQRRTNSATMPLDRAMDVWPESESPFVQVATLTLPRQNILARGQAEYGQGLAFNIWRTPKVNAPADESSIAVARKAVYMAGAAAIPDSGSMASLQAERPARAKNARTCSAFSACAGQVAEDTPFE